MLLKLTREWFSRRIPQEMNCDVSAGKPVKYLKVSEEFHTSPGPRYIDEGYWSGELFRWKHLAPALREAKANNEKLIVDLDGTTGYACCFLQEVFAGLVVVEGFTIEQLHNLMGFISKEEPYLIDEIWNYIDEL